MLRVSRGVVVILVVAVLLTLGAVAPAIAQTCGSGADTAKLSSFVTTLYLQVLGRLPSEISLWFDYIRSVPTVDGFRAMIHGFLDSPEYLDGRFNFANYVAVIYRVALGREASSSERAAWMAEILRRTDPVIAGFVESPEFVSAVLPSFQSVAHLENAIHRLYNQTLSRGASREEIDGWITYVQTTGDVEGMMRAFFESAEYLAVPRTLDDHLMRVYETILARTAGPPELAVWKAFIATQLAAVQDLIILSPEFERQCVALLS